jgi:putative ABC transport system substrate-binding protein
MTINCCRWTQPDTTISNKLSNGGTVPMPEVYCRSSAEYLDNTGFVASLARPGGNITGLSGMSPELSAKRLELLREIVPGLSRVAFLWSPEVRGALFEYQETESAARAMQLQLQSVEVRRAEDLDRAFSAVTNQHAQALVVSASPITNANPIEIATFANRNKLPSIYAANWFVDAGGLMSYAASGVERFRRAARYVDQILKGRKPGDLPIELPMRFDFVVNLKTAKTLGLTMPPHIILQATQVIQ